VIEIVDAAPTPRVVFDHRRTRMAVVSYPALPSIELLAEPLLRLAGVRIDPARTERQRTRYYDAITISSVEPGAGNVVTLQTPAGARLGLPDWSPTGDHVVFTVTADDGVELWVASTQDGSARRVFDGHVNTTLGDAYAWRADGRELIVKLVPTARGPAPAEPKIPPGPMVEETEGREAKNRTYQDLLRNAYDDALFDHYFTCQLARVDLEGKVTPVGVRPTESTCWSRRCGDPTRVWCPTTASRTPWRSGAWKRRRSRFWSTTMRRKTCRSRGFAPD
jgi:dipeptidyl aminopeptidase/acylaminoacyl peptidase